MAFERETIEMIGAITGGLGAGAGLLAAVQKIKGPKTKAEVLKNLDITLTEMYSKIQVMREENAVQADEIIKLKRELEECNSHKNVQS